MGDERRVLFIVSGCEKFLKFLIDLEFLSNFSQEEASLWDSRVGSKFFYGIFKAQFLGELLRVGDFSDSVWIESAESEVLNSFLVLEFFSS